MIIAFIELFFIIFKTIVLSTIYSTIVLLALIIFRKNKWINNILKHKLIFWLITHFIVSVGLFLFSFTYWQYTGLGDNSRIPIGYGQTIQSEEFEWTYFYPDLNKTEPNKDELIITNYIIFENKICAEVSHENTISPEFDFIVYDLLTKKIKTFRNEKEYTEFANKNVLPNKDKFYNFEKHFEEYLTNRPFWKIWMVP